MIDLRSHLMAALSVLIVVVPSAGLSSILQKEDAKMNQDSISIRAAVYRYMFELHGKSSKEAVYYSAYYIDETEQEGKQIILSLSQKFPPVRLLSQTFKSQSQIDSYASNSIKVFSVKILKRGNHDAEAVGSWHSGKLASGKDIFILRKIRNSWCIVSWKREIISGEFNIQVHQRG